MKYFLIGIGIEPSPEAQTKRLCIDIGIRSTRPFQPMTQKLLAAAVTVALFCGSIYLLHTTDIPVESQQQSIAIHQ